MGGAGGASVLAGSVSIECREYQATQCDFDSNRGAWQWRTPRSSSWSSRRPTSRSFRSTTRTRAPTSCRGPRSPTSSRLLASLEKRTDLAGLVIRSTKPGNFIAGADLREFVADLDRPADEVAGVSRQGQQLFGRLSKTPFVTVAAIDGICVGGGAELAIWCDRRLMADNEADELRLSRSEARPAPRLGRHGPHAADRRPLQRRRADHQRRADRRQSRLRDGAGGHRAHGCGMNPKNQESKIATATRCSTPRSA